MLVVIAYAIWNGILRHKYYYGSEDRGGPGEDQAGASEAGGYQQQVPDESRLEDISDKPNSMNVHSISGTNA